MARSSTRWEWLGKASRFGKLNKFSSLGSPRHASLDWSALVCISTDQSTLAGHPWHCHHHPWHVSSADPSTVNFGSEIQFSFPESASSETVWSFKCSPQRKPCEPHRTCSSSTSPFLTSSCCSRWHRHWSTIASTKLGISARSCARCTRSSGQFLAAPRSGRWQWLPSIATMSSWRASRESQWQMVKLSGRLPSFGALLRFGLSCQCSAGIDTYPKATWQPAAPTTWRRTGGVARTSSFTDSLSTSCPFSWSSSRTTTSLRRSPPTRKTCELKRRRWTSRHSVPVEAAMTSRLSSSWRKSLSSPSHSGSWLGLLTWSSTLLASLTTPTWHRSQPSGAVFSPKPTRCIIRSSTAFLIRNTKKRWPRSTLGSAVPVTTSRKALMRRRLPQQATAAPSKLKQRPRLTTPSRLYAVWRETKIIKFCNLCENKNIQMKALNGDGCDVFDCSSSNPPFDVSCSSPAHFDEIIAARDEKCNTSVYDYISCGLFYGCEVHLLLRAHVSWYWRVKISYLMLSMYDMRGVGCGKITIRALKL